MTTKSQVHAGDCLDVLRTMPDNSIDSIVTDPPYGLALMGKRWDYDVPSVEIWAECLRVLKPGAHLLAFAGTRTQHRMAVRIEDAGFEIRDMVAWVYATGFPKSRDLTEPMRRWLSGDRLQADSLGRTIKPDVYTVTGFLRDARDRAGWTNKRIDDLFGTNGMAGHWTSKATQPAVPSVRQWQTLKEALQFGDDVDAIVERLAATERPEEWGNANEEEEMLERLRSGNELGATQSFGTSLKPALEPITIARKPPAGTMAANVMTHGTGALNLDGCRIQDGTETGTGRWPANLIHDGSAQVLNVFPIDNGQSVARFFFQPKAKPEDRHAGVDRNPHPTVKPTDLMRYLCRLVTPRGGTVLDPFTGSGSTGRGAVLEGFRFVGIERDPDYVKIAQARILAAETGGTVTGTQGATPGQLGLFDLVPRTGTTQVQPSA